MADRRLTRESIDAYADLSSDHNPLHVDEALASQSRFGGIIAHGFLLLGGPLNALAEAFDYPLTLECRFEAPGRPGDVLQTIVDVSEDGEAATFRVVNEADHARVSGTLRGGVGGSDS